MFDARDSRDCSVYSVYNTMIVMQTKAIQKSYQFRCYPTREQARLLNMYFGHARWVWNWTLSARIKAYRRRGEHRSGVYLGKMLTHLKSTSAYPWLKEAPATIYTQALRDQDRAFANFFAHRAKYPRFKKRAHAQSIRFQLDQRVVQNMYAPGKMLKLTGLGCLKLRWSQTPAGTPKMVTVRRKASGKYYVTFMCEVPAPAYIKAKHPSVGVDFGLTHLAITSHGQKHLGNKYLRRSARSLRRAQQKLSRKVKGSNRWHNQRRRVARLHEKISNQRNDALHKLSSQLVHENQVIGLEDLHVKGMLRNHSLALSISDAGWSELRRQLEYKAEWYGRSVVVIDRWEPTSKVCSDCGALEKDMPLSRRTWTCAQCHAPHDRDINAAININRIATGGRPGCNARGGVSSGLAAVPLSETNPGEARIYPKTEAAEWTAARA